MSGKLNAQNEKTPSHSALTCAIYFGQYYSVFETATGGEEEDTNFLYLDDGFDDVFRKLVQAAHGTNDEIGNLAADLQLTIERKIAAGGPNNTEPPEEMTELTMLCDHAENNYLTIDASEDAVHFVAIRGCMPLQFVLSALLQLISSFLQQGRLHVQQTALRAVLDPSGEFFFPLHLSFISACFSVDSSAASRTRTCPNWRT